MDHASEFNELEREQARLLAASLPAAVAAEVNKSPDGLTARALVASGGNLSLFYQEVANSPEAPREVRDLASDYMQKTEAQREAENDAFRRTVTGVGEAVFASSVIAANNAYAANLTRENEQPGGPNGANASGSLANNLLGLSAQQMNFLQSISSMTQQEWDAKSTEFRQDTITTVQGIAQEKTDIAVDHELEIDGKFASYLDQQGLTLDERRARLENYEKAKRFYLGDPAMAGENIEFLKTFGGLGEEGLEFAREGARAHAARSVGVYADVHAQAAMEAEQQGDTTASKAETDISTNAMEKSVNPNKMDYSPLPADQQPKDNDPLANLINAGTPPIQTEGMSPIVGNVVDVGLAQSAAAMGDAALSRGAEVSGTAEEQADLAASRAGNVDARRGVDVQVAQVQVSSAPVENDYGDDEPAAPAAVDLAANPALDDSHPAARTNDLTGFQAAQSQFAALDAEASAAPADDPAFLPTRRPAAGLSSQAGM